MTKEERFRKALAALQKYCENPKNPLSGPELYKLLDEVHKAGDDLRGK